MVKIFPYLVVLVLRPKVIQSYETQYAEYQPKLLGKDVTLKNNTKKVYFHIIICSPHGNTLLQSQPTVH